MHSTVQTGLYTQNIFGYNYNFYHPPGSTKSHNPYPPAPHNYHPHKNLPPVCHYHCEIDEHGQLNNITGSAKKLNEGLVLDTCKNPLCSSNSNINNLNNNNNNNRNNKSESRLGTLMRKFKYFWHCTKPCGILAFVFGFLLLLASISGFLFLQVELLCEKAQTCYNATLKVLSVAFLVISIVICFFGFVIVIYTKRDQQAGVIVASTKHLDYLDSKLQERRHISSSQLNLTNKNLGALANNLSQPLVRSTSYLTINKQTVDELSVKQPLLKSKSLITLNKSKSASTSKLNEN